MQLKNTFNYQGNFNRACTKITNLQHYRVCRLHTMFINRIINNVATSLMQKAVLQEFKFKNKYPSNFERNFFEKMQIV